MNNVVARATRRKKRDILFQDSNERKGCFDMCVGCRFGTVGDMLRVENAVFVVMHASADVKVAARGSE